MKLIYNTLNFLIFIWGTLCLNGFREDLKYNALGDYTETNIDINTLSCISLLNNIMIITNFTDNMFLYIWNNIVTLLLAGINMYTYSNCRDLCRDFYSEDRFYSYLAFYSILPYIQFILGFLMFTTLLKSGNKYKCKENSNEQINDCNDRRRLLNV
jgi:hypothetical protein